MDFSTFQTVGQKKKPRNIQPIEDIIKEAKTTNTYQFIITVKLSEAFGTRGKIRISVTNVKDNYIHASSMGTLKNKDILLKKFVREYKKMGKLKVVDLTEQDDNNQ